MLLKRRSAFLLVYISIIIAMLFTFFYIQKRYGRTPSRSRSENIHGIHFLSATAQPGRISPLPSQCYPGQHHRKNSTS